jgi:hypothetical protein
MERDGRLEAFMAHSRSSLGPQPPKPCGNCGRDAKPLRKGRCQACAEYLRCTGRERPYIVDGRRERRAARAAANGLERVV